MNDFLVPFDPKQLPAIEDWLKAYADKQQRKTDEAMSLAVTPETLPSVKAARAEINRDFSELEGHRKEAKTAYLAPYNNFEALYKQYVTEPHEKADRDLKLKIDSVEYHLREGKERAIRKYYAESLAAYGLEASEWPFERSNIRVLRSSSDKALKEAVRDYVDMIRNDVDAINQLPDADLVMAEYKRCGRLNAAQIRVQDMKQAAEAARVEREKRQFAKEKAQEAEAKVEAVMPAEEVLELRFTVRGTKTKLRELKRFLDNGGYDYE